MITKKYQKILCAGICFLLFLFIGFFYLSINRANAVNLEVQYPVISGQNLNADTNLTLPRYVLYLFNAGMFLGFFSVFISLIIAGVMYLMSPINAELRSSARDRVFGAISGLLILALTYLIVTTINPQLSILNLNKLPPTPKAPAEKKSPGVYFYNKSGCSDKSAIPNTSSVPNLGNLKNEVNSVGIIQDPDTQTSYITILYENPNLWGKCQYITSNSGNSQSCQPVSPFASSASVHPYDFHSNGGGVYFYRKSCFDKISSKFTDINDLVSYCNKNSGGYYKVSISGIYVGKLEDLPFQNVPKEEQDCTEYDKNWNCNDDTRKAPNLGGENVSSIIINGNYIVLFVYFNPKTDSAMSWSSCQEFPSINDANKIGPQQMKWENIRNNGGVIPNYVVIIPVQS
jgi:hypothetical protein